MLNIKPLVLSLPVVHLQPLGTTTRVEWIARADERAVTLRNSFNPSALHILNVATPTFGAVLETSSRVAESTAPLDTVRGADFGGEENLVLEGTLVVDKIARDRS